ncbi:thiamine phosphate synthase [Mesosutterella sp. AGMB02718]|uniref:Thiamine-phosphate synthase n=1 Tax=Mesosutterella faecium TaxID=2925194 RepID=A0ABT7IJM6_9BURK|nr:thiamine phosphate synthase [Mesosutterella sp. AGMB02718]MDL2058567.1 thiamine phosphate synthase [Mesosutterella sp. AGMB02718]
MNSVNLELYLVLDPVLCGGEDGMVRTALEAVRGGCTIVQLRAPGWKKRRLAECGRALLKALAPSGTPLIVDDHVDVALAIGAQGVHVGQQDLQPQDARRLMGPRAIIGYSVSSGRELALCAPLVQEGAVDYLGIGPVWATATKPDAASPLGLAGFAELAARRPCPAVAIGAVNAGNAASLAGAGADGLAVVSAICGQPDPRAAAALLLHAFRQGLSR